MKTLEEIRIDIEGILKTDWKRRAGQKVPEPEDVALGNDSVEIEATVLYADLADSTGLVSGFKDWFAAEIYKAYLRSACELIKNNGGTITAFDGDRVMAVFFGDAKNSLAAKAALQINYVSNYIINDEVKKRYKETSFVLEQSVGIDCGKLFVAKTGVRGTNDLVWVGRSANYAAKMCSMRNGAYRSFITQEVFDKLNDASKYGGYEKKLMWDKVMWQEMGITIYQSTYWWKPD